MRTYEIPWFFGIRVPADEYIAVALVLLIGIPWLLEWHLRRGNGGMLAIRNPLAALTRSVSRLWRDRTLLSALIAFWVVSAGGTATYLAALNRSRLLWRRVSYLSVDAESLSSGWLSAMFVGVTPLSLPSAMRLPVSSFGLLLAAGVAAWVLYRLVRESSDGVVRAHLGLPAALTATGLAGGAVATWLALSRFIFMYAPPAPVLLVLNVLVAGLCLAPLWAALWYALMHTVRGRRWSASGAMAFGARCWPAAAVLAMILAVPDAALGHSAFSLDLIWYVSRTTHSATAAGILLGGGAVVACFLALVPWIIVDRECSVREALAYSRRLIRGRGRDVVVFALRFALLFSILHALLGLALALLGPSLAIQEVLMWLPRQFLLLLQLATVATAYAGLRTLHEARGGGSPSEEGTTAPRAEVPPGRKPDDTARD